MKSILTSLLLIISISVIAGNADTVNVTSASMRKQIKCVVITPDSYKQKEKRFPVVYLLHGFSGNYSNWIKKVPAIKQYADQYQFIIVCPDAAFSSWYFDSPIDSSFKYETFTATELPAFIDANYKTNAQRNQRAITGLSMGGHGGLYLGWRHADFFGAAGSMSGALVIDVIKNGYHVEKRLGDTLQNKQYWETYSFMHEMEKPAKQPLAIIMDCGTEDFIVEMSRKVHEKMLKLKIPHDYIERPGKHDWAYWSTAIKYQLLFFSEYFKTEKQ